jgi:hypothetical protein
MSETQQNNGEVANIDAAIERFCMIALRMQEMYFMS